MKNTLQNLVRIIIIGTFRSLVECHHPYLAIAPPPYVNSPVVEPLYHPREEPIYYPDKTIYSLPSPYQNVDFLSLPQLFFQDQNYRPPTEERSQVPPSSKHYLVPPHQKMYQPPYSPPHKKTSILITHNKVSPLAEVKQNFPMSQNINIRPQKEKIYPTLVYKKEKSPRPSHQEDISSENLEDDYSYNYSDDLLPPSKSPLLNYPYQHFRPVKPNHLKNVQSFSSCLNSKTSHDNIKKTSTDLKAPLTFLPSRFPPRIEELLQRIQNYFSTYTQQELQNPTRNSTSPAPTISVPQTTVSESSPPIVSETVETVSLSKPSENKEPSQANTEEGTQFTAVIELNVAQPVTEHRKDVTTSNGPSENKFKEQNLLTTVTVGPVNELNNNNKGNNGVYFPETTASTTRHDNSRNQQPIISPYPQFTTTEAFYLSKNPTESAHARPVETIHAQPTETIHARPTERIPPLPVETIQAHPAERIPAHPTERIPAHPTDRFPPHPVVTNQAHPTERFPPHPIETNQAHPAERIPPYPIEMNQAHPAERIPPYPVETNQAHPPEGIPPHPIKANPTHPSDTTQAHSAETIQSQLTTEETFSIPVTEFRVTTPPQNGVNHLDSHTQNIKTDLNTINSEQNQNENKIAFNNVMTTTNEIDHSNLTNSS